MSVGYHKFLEMSDVYQLRPGDKCDTITEQFLKNWDTQTK